LSYIESKTSFERPQKEKILCELLEKNEK